jgi:hypothetical protein
LQGRRMRRSARTRSMSMMQVLPRPRACMAWPRTMARCRCAMPCALWASRSFGRPGTITEPRALPDDLANEPV